MGGNDWLTDNTSGKIDADAISSTNHSRSNQLGFEFYSGIKYCPLVERRWVVPIEAGSRTASAVLLKQTPRRSSDQRIIKKTSLLN